jgi:hypothetical protein
MRTTKAPTTKMVKKKKREDVEIIALPFLGGYLSASMSA